MLSCVDHTTRTPMWLFRTAFVFLPSIFVRFHAKESMKDQKKPIHKVLLRKSLLLCCMGRNEDKGSFSCKPEDWYSMQLAVHGVYGEYSGTSSFQGWQCVYLSIDILVIVEGWESGYKMVSCTEQEKEETEEGGRKQQQQQRTREREWTELNGEGKKSKLSMTLQFGMSEDSGVVCKKERGERRRRKGVWKRGRQRGGIRTQSNEAERRIYNVIAINKKPLLCTLKKSSAFTV